jgi:hypothetical protein
VAAVGLAVVLLAIGARTITMYGFSTAGAAALADGDLDSSARQFSRSGLLNPVQPWRAQLGIGLAHYRNGDLLAGEAAFARALELAPERCDLRFNLAVTIEAQGDRVLAGDSLTGDDEDELFDAAATSRPPPATAFERFTTALEVIDARPCRFSEPAAVGNRLAESRERIAAKLAALEPEEPVGNDDRQQVEESADNERGDGEQIEELEARNEAGAAQREAGRDLDQSGATPDGQSNW